jgi:hypothetical protein
MISIIDNISLVFYIIVFLYIWFQTDALVEWAGLFRFKFLKYKEFNDTKKSALSSLAAKTYIDFLLFNYGSPKDDKWWSYLQGFFIRLITCPVCFTVWINVMAWCIFYHSWNAFHLLSFNIVASWYGYHKLKKVLDKLNE